MQRLVAITMFFFVCLLLGLPGAQSAVREASVEDSPSAAEQSPEKKPEEPGKASEETKEDDSEADSEKQESEESESDETKTTDKVADDDAKSDKKDDKKEKADNETDKKEKPDTKSAAKSGKPKKKAKEKPKPYKVKRDELKIEVDLDGTFVADEMEEVALRPEVWSKFTVLEAVEHGTEVKKGEVLVRFDDEKLKKDLAVEALSQSIGQLSLLQDEEEFPRIKRLLELSFEDAERRHEQTKEDYEYYLANDRPFTVKIANFRFKSAEEQLASAEEELKQLQQMYEADELTEETEEIVLRRQRFAVETAKLILELNKESRDYTLNVSLPRSDEYHKTSLEESELAYKQAKTAVEMGMTRKNYDMEKKRTARAKSMERHGKLLSDKGLMELRAPCDGVVYYGKCTNGKWSQIASLKAKLKPFGTATPKSVLMTIVKPGTLHIESSLSEKNLPDVTAGLKATLIPAADKELELEGKVAHVDTIPGASNKFRVDLEVDLAKAPEWLVAGMTCDAKIVTYENKEALVIPLDLVQTDKENEKIKYVMLVEAAEDGVEQEKPSRRNVKLGRKKGKIVEILKGLEEGDEIVKEEKKDEED
ncbi:MAG: HlyD family efflux transporter periplasmic adaptor subunit [Planctomycetes bacterium]|nr:HlyD family efflux transporter periplasmic adaptor subunit [Planctomycetota bacterium]